MPKYTIRAPRFVDGQYVRASPESPAVIEVPKGSKVDAGMEPLEVGVEPEPSKLHPAHAPRDAGHVHSTPTAAQVQSKPAHPDQAKGRRATDSEKL